MPLSPAYHSALRVAIFIQIITLLAAALILDDGLIALLTAALSLTFWLFTTLTLYRRPHSPTHGDLFFIRYWLLLTFPVAFAIEAVLIRLH